MAIIAKKSKIIEYPDSPFELDNHRAYLAWQKQKLTDYPTDSKQLIVEIADMSCLTRAEKAKMCAILFKTNMVIYSSQTVTSNVAETKLAIRALASQFGLNCAEGHRSADEESIVAVEVSAKSSKRGYIPYSNKPLNWHSDGYYNRMDDQIGAFILHCAQNARKGGQNQLLDPEIAYIRLRDENPAFIEALSHPEAMTIPFNTEADGSIRPDSVGPVFKLRPDGRGITLRYTARTRSIKWRDDATTRDAVSFLNHLLDGNEPLIQTITLRPGQGLLNNNVLHNRTGFENSSNTGETRLIYRMRFFNKFQANNS